MPAATTIVVAREDFSIPGGEPHEDSNPPEPVALESRFFSLLRESKPDVVVLDLRQANGVGVGMILNVLLAGSKCAIAVPPKSISHNVFDVSDTIPYALNVCVVEPG